MAGSLLAVTATVRAREPTFTGIWNSPVSSHLEEDSWTSIENSKNIVASNTILKVERRDDVNLDSAETSSETPTLVAGHSTSDPNVAVFYPFTGKHSNFALACNIHVFHKVPVYR